MRIRIETIDGQKIAKVAYSGKEVTSGASRRPYMMSVDNLGKLVREISRQIEDKNGKRSFVLTKALLYGVSLRRSHPADRKTLKLDFSLPVESEKESVQAFSCLVTSNIADQKEAKPPPLFSEGFAKVAIPTSFLAPVQIDRLSDGSEIHSFSVHDLDINKNFLDHDDETIGRYLLVHLHSLNNASLAKEIPHLEWKEALEKTQTGYRMVGFKITDPEFVALLGGIWELKTFSAEQERHFSAGARVKDRLSFDVRKNPAPDNGGWPS